MSTLKEKTQVFIIGLLIGLLVAGGFFLFKLDDYFKELNFYKHFAENFSSEKKAEKMEAQNDKKENKKEQNPKTTKQIEKETVKTKPLHSDTTKSILIDSVVTNNIDPEEIIVKKDEMINSKTQEIINLNPIAKTNISKDSLLHKVSGINEGKEAKPFLNIEFWQSPLNYKGYKMSKYKLIIYGINPTDPFKLFKIDESVYLKSNSSIYKLDYTFEFKPYEKITDEGIISKLK